MTRAEEFKAELTAIQLTQERQLTHGDFDQNAAVSQDIKIILRNCDTWDSLTPAQREALDMIALKISRIMSGKANHKDHWDDIQGYAELAKK